MLASRLNPGCFLGRSPDDLGLAEGIALAGKWIAMELYTPKKLPLRTIQAIGANIAACLDQLRERNLDPHDFEFQQLRPPV